MKIINTYLSSLPHIPWSEKPRNCARPCWRHPKNPIIPRDLLPTAWGIYNSAAVPFKDGFAGVFRVDNERRRMALHAGFSQDGISWQLEPEPIAFATREEEMDEFQWGYDPRVVWVEDRWYILWCNEYHGPTIGVAWTQDFHAFHQLENTFLPYNRNGVLFPRKIGGRFAMLSRPSDNGHTPFGDIFYSESPDMTFWGRHRWVAGRRRGWESLKMGPGPAPIETTEGWLAFTHGVFTSCSGYVYSMGVLLLDRERPWKVICRPGPFLLAPMETYEMVGATPNVIFPCATLSDAATGRIAIYYGAADTCVGLAFAQLDELISWMRANDDPGSY